MNRFLVEVPERWVGRYVVDAGSPEDAVAIVRTNPYVTGVEDIGPEFVCQDLDLDGIEVCEFNNQRSSFEATK